MSEPTRRDLLKKALEEMADSWTLGSIRMIEGAPTGTPMEEIVDRQLAKLDEFAVEYERRFGERPDPLRLFSEDPYKAKAFFQIDTFRVSLEMKLMIWRLLHGCEIEAIQFHYQAGQKGELAVTLRTPDGQVEGPYQGRPLDDFCVLRHFGAGLVAGKLALRGYYALK